MWPDKMLTGGNCGSLLANVRCILFKGVVAVNQVLPGPNHQKRSKLALMLYWGARLSGKVLEREGELAEKGKRSQGLQNRGAGGRQR